MTNKSEWQEANRRLLEEQRRKLGDPPTAEEMLAYSRGELTGQEEERIRERLAAYPELARMYAAPVPDAPRPGDADAVSDEEVLAGLEALQRRLGGSGTTATVHRGRFAFRHYIPTSIAAAVALVFFAAFVQAESRARHLERAGLLPRILGEPQELEPGVTRGGAAATMLRTDGDAYLLKPRLRTHVRHPHYSIELHDAQGTVLWTNKTAQPGVDDAFQIAVPREFLRAGRRYQLRIFGLDGKTRSVAESYSLAVPSE
ncbi:MAG TPA: hypothetical protein VGF28_13125 [Thermoanaerobaculia bacterium]|jgi:hypothetical protein